MDKDKEFLKKIEEIMEEFRKTDEEVLNNPDIPQELKDKLIKLRAEEDRNKKIIGHSNDDFLPIYGN